LKRFYFVLIKFDFTENKTENIIYTELIFKTISMKTIITIFTLLLLSFYSEAQCIADAGGTKAVCSSWNSIDTIFLGATPSANFGQPPYTYIWEAYQSIQIGQFTFETFASDLLDDTTIANPRITSTLENPIYFFLTVIDANNDTCKDSALVFFSNFNSHLGTFGLTINQGDSVNVNFGPNIGGGIGSLSYLWRPNHGLIDSTNATFSTSPDYSIHYYVTATDSLGCASVGSPFIYIQVIPVSSNLKEEKNIFQIYPNPTKDFVIIDFENENFENLKVEFFDFNGKMIFQKEITSNKNNINLNGFSKGIYFYQISNKTEILEKGKLMIE
jgi:hypothetical protein